MPFAANGTRLDPEDRPRLAPPADECLPGDPCDAFSLARHGGDPLARAAAEHRRAMAAFDEARDAADEAKRAANRVDASTVAERRARAGRELWRRRREMRHATRELIRLLDEADAAEMQKEAA